MRVLQRAPDAVVDEGGRPRFGSYFGSVGRGDLSAVSGGRLARIAREKRWVYVGIASEAEYVALLIARLGYVANVFAYVLDARTMRMIATASTLAPPGSCEVADGTSAPTLAAFRLGRQHARVERNHAGDLLVDAEIGPIAIRATLATRDAPPAITAIAPVGSSRHALVNATEKRALLAATGDVRVRGSHRAFRGALAGYDYTHGLLARRTAWRWAYALGRAKSGERVAFNLVQGFVGEPECAAWVEGEVFPLAEGRFAFDADNPLAEWRVSTADGAVDLRFTPGGLHSEEKNLGVVASRFVQPAGAYRGTMRVGGRDLVLERVLGVAEDQDVLW
jgi:hypothetical protein